MRQLELYFKKNENKNLVDLVEPKSQRTAMHIAAKEGNANILKLLIKNQAYIDSRDKMLKTPLHYACEHGHREAVEYLINRNSDPFEEDNCGRSALHYAVYSSQVDVIISLTSEFEDLVSKRDHAGRTALHHAVFIETNDNVYIDKKGIQQNASGDVIR